MGLDCYWTKENGDELENVEFDPPLKLCGGMLSEHGFPSFRGKVYSDIIALVDGCGLYVPRPHSDIVEISRKLEEFEMTDEMLKESDYEISREEYNDLKRMFKKMATIPEASLTVWY